MRRSKLRARSWVAAGTVAALLFGTAALAGGVPADDGSGDEPTPEQVKAKFFEVDRSVRNAEDALARSLLRGASRDEAVREAGAAGKSVAKLLDSMRNDGHRASDAMQWIIDNAPQ